MKLFFDYSPSKCWQIVVAEDKLSAAVLLAQNTLDVTDVDLEELPLDKQYVLRFVNAPLNPYMVFGYTECVKTTEFLFRTSTVESEDLEELVQGWLEVNSPGTPWFRFDELRVYDIAEYRWFTIKDQESARQRNRAPAG